MDEQSIPDVPQQPAGRPQKLVFETPNKALSYVAFVAGILGIIGAVVTVIVSAMPLITIIDFSTIINTAQIRNVFWFISFGLLVVTVVISMVSNAKRIGSSVITHRAEICGIITAVILIISTFVRMFAPVI